jgi:hypothetical protein
LVRGTRYNGQIRISIFFINIFLKIVFVPSSLTCVILKPVNHNVSNYTFVSIYFFGDVIIVY